MNEKFEVGEIAIFNTLTEPDYKHLHGEECLIIAGLAPREMVFKTGSRTVLDCYIVQVLATNELISTEPQHLRKKKPPQAEAEIDETGDINSVVSWDDCIWKPSKVEV